MNFTIDITARCIPTVDNKLKLTRGEAKMLIALLQSALEASEVCEKTLQNGGGKITDVRVYGEFLQ